MQRQRESGNPTEVGRTILNAWWILGILVLLCLTGPTPSLSAGFGSDITLTERVTFADGRSCTITITGNIDPQQSQYATWSVTKDETETPLPKSDELALNAFISSIQSGGMEVSMAMSQANSAVATANANGGGVSNNMITSTS